MPSAWSDADAESRLETGVPDVPPIQFRLTGTVGANYVIQVRTNLSLGNWVTLQTNASPVTFVDTNASQYPQRFYRAVTP